MNWITDISFALTLYILIHISFLCLCYRWIIQVGSTTVVEYGKISDEMPKQCHVCFFVFQFCTNPSHTIVGASQMWSMGNGVKKELRSGISELRHVKCQVEGLQQFVHWLKGFSTPFEVTQ